MSKIVPTKHENPSTKQECLECAHYWLEKAITMTNEKLKEVSFKKALDLENRAFSMAS